MSSLGFTKSAENIGGWRPPKIVITVAIKGNENVAVTNSVTPLAATFASAKVYNDDFANSKDRERETIQRSNRQLGHDGVLPSNVRLL